MLRTYLGPIILLSAILTPASATATDSFCESDKGVSEIRDYILCQNNPKLDSCFNVSAQRLKNAGMSAAAGAMTTGGMLATRLSADYYLRSGRTLDAIRRSGPVLNETFRELTRRLNPGDADELARLIRGTGKNDDYTKALLRSLETRKTGTTPRRVPLLVLDKSGPRPVYVDVVNDRAANQRLLRAMENQAGRFVPRGFAPQLPDALNAAFGSDELLVSYGRGGAAPVNVVRNANASFRNGFRGTFGVFDPPETSVLRALSRGAVRTVGPRSALLLGGAVGAAVFIGTELISGTASACANPQDVFINQDSNCDEVYEVNQNVANFLSEPGSVQVARFKSTLNVCRYYKNLHARLFPPFQTASLRCQPRNNGFTLDLTEGGVRTEFVVNNFGNQGIQQIAIRRNGTRGPPITFDARLNPVSGLNASAAANFRSAKIFVPAAAACCAQDAAGRSECRTEFNRENANANSPLRGTSAVPVGNERTR